MSIVIKEEQVSDFLEEIIPILHRHYGEIDHYFKRFMPLHPDYPGYLEMGKDGSLQAFIARDRRSTIVGYAIYLVNTHPHYESKVFALNDMLYVDNAYRKKGLAKELISYAEKVMNYDFTTISMKAGHEFPELLEHYSVYPVH